MRAESEARTLHERAGQEGYQAGLTKGEAEARRQLESAAEQLRRLLLAAAEEQSRALAAIEDMAAPLLYSALTRIIGGLTPSAELVESCMRQAQAEVLGREAMRVRLHPDDAALLALDDKQQLLDEAGRSVTIVADRQVTGGGCVIETARGDLDAQLTTQLDRLRQALLSMRT